MPEATIGALRVVLGLDSANFTKGLGRAQSQLLPHSFEGEMLCPDSPRPIAGGAACRGTKVPPPLK